MKKYLITGVAGFIGSEVAEELLLQDHCVIGTDNLNDYYNPDLKKDRLQNIENIVSNKNDRKFIESDIKDLITLKMVFLRVLKIFQKRI